MESTIPNDIYKESLSTALDLSSYLKRILRRKRLYKTEVKSIPADLTNVCGLKSTIIPYEIDGQTDSLSSFIEVVKAYCSTVKKDLDYDSIMLYSGISGTACTLHSVGEKNQVTRERVRQVRRIHINKIKKLVSGLIVNGLKCDSLVIKQINDLRDKFYNYTFFKDKDINDILKPENIYLSEERKPHLLLFFDIFNIKNSSMIYCYVTRKIATIRKIKKLFKKIKKILYKEITAKSLVAIAKKFNVTCAIAKAVINVIPEIEEIEKHKYQIKNSKLSAVDLSYRILSIAKKPIDNQDLINTVNDLRDKPITYINLSCDDRFENIGLTGLWTVKSLKVNKSYIYQLVKKALKHFNRPCDIHEIYEYIKNIRSDTKLENIRRIISVYARKYFLRLRNKKVILIEWKKLYKIDIPDLKRKKYQLDYTGKFDLSLSKILVNKTMTCSELSIELAEITGFDRNNCLNRIYKSKAVLLDRHNCPITASLNKNFRDLLNHRVNNRREKIIETITNIFKMENKTELKKSYIIKEVLKTHDVSKPMLYVLLRDKSKFLIKGKLGRSLLISLNTGFKNG